jgi:hypothetical protein
MKILRWLAITLIALFTSTNAFADNPIGSQTSNLFLTSSGFATIFTPTQNARGATLRTCTGYVNAGTTLQFTFIAANSTTPTDIHDAGTYVLYLSAAPGAFASGALAYPLSLPPGQGLYVYTSATSSSEVFCSYDLF